MTITRTLILTFLLAVAGPAQSDEAPPLAKIITVAAQDGNITRQFFGRVVAKETVDLAFQVGGQLVELPVIEGEPVEKGGLVARLDLEPFQLALEQAQAEKDQADRTLARLEKLEGSTVSQVSVEDARTQAELADINLRNAERALRQAELRAPFDALVAARDVPNYSTIGAGTPIARLHDMSELRIEIDVPELLFQQAGRDPDVDLWAEFPASSTRYPLKTREFNAETSEVGQTFRITLGMPPPEEIHVFPGSSVTVTAVIRQGKPRRIIPASAVMIGNDGATSVMVFRPDEGTDDTGTVTRTPVEVAPTPEGRTELLSGVEEGQEILASGVARLEDGQRVRRFAGFPN